MVDSVASRRPSRRTGVLVALAALLAGVVVAVPTAPVAHADSQIDIAAPGPLGPITVIGDSVLVGATIAPSLPTLLAEHGFGPVRFRAGLGYTAGNFQPAGSSFAVANWIRWWRAAGWDPVDVAVNLGNNDVGFCRTDVACNVGTIEYVLDAIGPGHRVWWSKITRFYTLQAEADAYNHALDLVAASHPELHVWDWPAAQQAGAIPLFDGIHLRDSAAYRQRSVLMAADITNSLARASHTGGDAAIPLPTGAPSEYLPLEPERLLDTRSLGGGRLGGGAVQQLDLSAEVPPGTTAVAVNVTAVDPAAAGFLTAYPCTPSAPTVSSANYTGHTDRGALAVVPVSAGLRLCVLTSAPADLIVDLQGAFVAAADRFTPVVPDRLVDTRVSGRSQLLELAVPSGAEAVALNLTATDGAAAGFMTAFPCGGDVPPVSNVNFRPGETVAGAAFVPVSAAGTVCVFTNVAVDVVVDLTGTFSPDGALRFTPAEPGRVYDTRDGTGGWTPVHGAQQVTDVRVAPPDAAAVTGTLTLVTPAADGFLTAFGCGDVPPTSNVNAARGGVLANSVTVGLAGAGRLCVRSHSATHVVFDTTGWWAP